MADRPSSWRGFGAVWADVRGMVRHVARVVARRPVASLLVVGVALRLSRFLSDKGFWLDEASLLRNIADRTRGGFLEPMSGTQLVPAGFLAVEVALGRILGIGEMAMRLFPFLCGVGALLAFAALTGRLQADRAAARLFSLAIFAVSGDLVYYTSELKPYATDVASAVACTLAGLASLRRRPTPLGFAGLTALGMIVVWFSFPAALVLAGVGVATSAAALRRRESGTAVLIGLVCLAWLVSFGASQGVARQLLGAEGAKGMQAFWGFGFPPWPPGTLREGLWPLLRVAYLFANPLDYHSRLVPAATPLLSFPAAAICAVGAGALRRRDPDAFWLLTAPLLLALGTAYARLYPFHGRLVLFLAPALILLLGEGAGRIFSATRSRAVRVLVLVLLLAPPLGRYAYRFIESGWDSTHNAVGDLRPFRHRFDRFPF